MPRTVLIIPADADALDYLDQAAEAGASEILTGVPPALLEHVQQDEHVDVVEHVETDDDGEPVSSVPSVTEATVVVIDEPETEPHSPPQDAPGTPQVDDVRRDVDALLRLILEPHSGPTNTETWSAVIAGMVDRGTATQLTIDGAANSAKVISSGARAELTARLADLELDRRA